MAEVPDKPLRFSLRNLGTAFKNFFKANKNGDHAGYPTFKTKRSNQSAQYQRESVRFDEYTGLLSIIGVKNIEVRVHRRIMGRIGTTTVSKSKTGKYYVSFQVDTGEELPPERPIDESKVVGIDLGIICYAGTSDGQKISNPRPIKDSEDRLAVLSKRLSKKVEGSKNYEKARKRIAVVHEKIEHQRRDFQHKLSRGFVDNYDAIVIRPMDSQKMAQANPYFAKSIYDAGWFEFKRQLQYKSAWKGKSVIEVGKGLASTRTCSHCGYVMPKVGLDEREWQCPKCYYRHDREVNAAINIKSEGIDQIRTKDL